MNMWKSLVEILWMNAVSNMCLAVESSFPIKGTLSVADILMSGRMAVFNDYWPDSRSLGFM